MKQIYGQIVINALAHKVNINNTEGILFSEFDLLAEEIEKVVNDWNKRNYQLSLEAKEPIQVVETS